MNEWNKQSTTYHIVRIVSDACQFPASPTSLARICMSAAWAIQHIRYLDVGSLPCRQGPILSWEGRQYPQSHNTTYDCASCPDCTGYGVEALEGRENSEKLRRLCSDVHWWDWICSLTMCEGRFHSIYLVGTE